jgi:uroporphyrin-III C-methyltransferase/precorrin-2 dehydrogenase/sirohydrochlorin ferrochelatase
VDNYVSKETEIVYVGKECSKKASTPQSSINELMVEYALQNKTVARLKGGDVSIFSNILDELQVLKENKIAYEIIPGVTAALGAAAYAGMPLTARGYATSVRFLTYYKSEILTEEYWKEIAETNDTLVFYMSVGNLNNLVDKFKEYSVSSEKKIAVIEQATTPFQKVYTSSFEDFAQKLGHKLFASPSLVVIGKIVNLHEEFSWLQDADREGLYFKSITNGSLLPKTQNFFEYAV